MWSRSGLADGSDADSITYHSHPVTALDATNQALQPCRWHPSSQCAWAAPDCCVTKSNSSRPLPSCQPPPAGRQRQRSEGSRLAEPGRAAPSAPSSANRSCRALLLLPSLSLLLLPLLLAAALLALLPPLLQASSFTVAVSARCISAGRRQRALDVGCCWLQAPPAAALNGPLSSVTSAVSF